MPRLSLAVAAAAVAEVGAMPQILIAESTRPVAFIAPEKCRASTSTRTSGAVDASTESSTTLTST
jgi:hypothetical protein